MIIMQEDIPDEDIPVRYKTDIQDFVMFYCDRDKSLAQSYVSQLRNLGFTGCLFNDDSYLNWWHTFEYDLVHELSKRSVMKFFLVTSEIQHDENLSLHRCETLMTAVKTKENSLVPIFEISKDDIPDTSQFYGLRTLTGLYSAALKNGSRFKWLFNLEESQKRKRKLKKERDKSLEEWKKEERLTRQKRRLVEEKKEEKRQKERERRHNKDFANVDKLAEDEIQREDLQRREEDQFQKLRPRLRELGEETGKSPEERYTMTEKRRILETVNQMKEDQIAKKSEGAIEDQKGAAKAAGNIHYHIVIENAHQSEIKIGPSYDTDRASPVLQPENNLLHRETKRQFTTDGAGSEPSSVEKTDTEWSRYLVYSKESSGQQDIEQETSSVEFDVPRDPTVSPARVINARNTPTMLTRNPTTKLPPARITDANSTPKNQQVQKRPDKNDVIIEGSQKGNKQAKESFNFEMFLQDDNENEDPTRVNEFSEDRLKKTTTDHRGISEKGTLADNNMNTESMSTEVHVHSSWEPVTGSSNTSEAALAPPWAPKPSLLSKQMQAAELGQVDHPLEELLVLDTLDSTEIILHTKEAGHSDIAMSDLQTVTKPAPLPELPNLWSEESFSTQQSGKTDEYSNDSYHQMMTMSESNNVADSEEPVVQPQITETPEVPHCSESSSVKSIIRDITTEQPQSTPTSLQDHTRLEAVQVCESESQDDRNTAQVVDNDISEQRDSSLNTGQPALNHTPKEMVRITEDLDDPRHPAAAAPNTLGDSGIEMDQITEAQGVLVSGFQQLSTATVSMQHNIQDFHFQESRPDPSTTSYNVETGKRPGFNDEDTSLSQQESWQENQRASGMQMGCTFQAIAMQTGCASQAADEDTCGITEYRPSSQEQPHGVANGKRSMVTSTHSSEDIEGAAIPGTDDHQKDATASVGGQDKQFDELRAQQEVSTDQECLQSLYELSGDLELIRRTGTWV